MNRLIFKTNINCGSCINSVTPFLNREINIDSWSVNTDHEDKILTVSGDVSGSEIVEIVEKAGFEAKEILN